LKKLLCQVLGVKEDKAHLIRMSLPTYLRSLKQQVCFSFSFFLIYYFFFHFIYIYISQQYHADTPYNTVYTILIYLQDSTMVEIGLLKELLKEQPQGSFELNSQSTTDEWNIHLNPLLQFFFSEKISSSLKISLFSNIFTGGMSVSAGTIVSFPSCLPHRGYFFLFHFFFAFLIFFFIFFFLY
jgi:hypothetical protein